MVVIGIPTLLLGIQLKMTPQLRATVCQNGCACSQSRLENGKDDFHDNNTL